MTRRTWHAFFSFACVLAACRPNFDDDPALISAPRILAVKSEPAEAPPGTALVFSAFVAEPSSANDAENPSWYFCSAPKPVAENNVVSSACLEPASLQAAGEGNSITAVLPQTGCTSFGPNPPPGGFRPRDPDATGGYFQPLRVDLSDAAPVFHSARIACNLADASADLASAFARAYVPNQNPHLLPLHASIDGTDVSLEQIPRGASVTLETGWLAEDAESYAYFDRSAQNIVTRREALTVSWYVNRGKFETEANGHKEDDFATSVENHWQVPANAGPARFWLVLRDSRGGTDFTSYTFEVN